MKNTALLLAAAASLALAACHGPALRECGAPAGSAWQSEARPGDRSGGRLRAGIVDDNVDPDAYRRYFAAYPGRNVGRFDVTDSSVLAFVDPDGRPVSFAPVRIFAEGREVYRARTTAGGRVMFPPAAAGVDAGACRFTADVDDRRVSFRRDEPAPLVVDVPQPDRDAIDVDVAFCLDTTGSMGDEIRRLKDTLRDVVDRLDGLRPRPRFRFGMVLYRDHGDDYVTRVCDFKRDLDDFLDALRGVDAAGGGDYEEAVDEGLRRAVGSLSWKRGDAIRICFLIGDAPPHGDAGRSDGWADTLCRAVEDGIQIDSVAASGLDDKGEFLWRQLAQFTLGKFMFISYGGGTPHHVGEYAENNLDDLMVRAVEAEVRSLGASRPPRRSPTRGRGRDAEDFDDGRAARQGSRFREYRE